jgi:hypothetical protein
MVPMVMFLGSFALVMVPTRFGIVGIRVAASVPNALVFTLREPDVLVGIDRLPGMSGRS